MSTIEAQQNKLTGIAQTLTTVDINSHSAGIVGQFCGAIYSLRKAIDLGVMPMHVIGDEEYMRTLRDAVTALADGTEPPWEWSANFPLNNALHRIANIADRMAGGSANRKDFWKNDSDIERVYEHVNHVKHEQPGSTNIDDWPEPERADLSTAFRALSREVGRAKDVWTKRGGTPE